MNNDTNATILAEDLWTLVLDNAFVIPSNTAFILFITMGVTTLLCGLVVSCRQCRQRDSKCPQSTSQWCSCLCVVVFFGMVAAGFFVMGGYAQQYRSLDHDVNIQHGTVKILDTRIVVENITIDSIVQEGLLSQARVVFGGEWACGVGRKETYCNVFSTITECSRIVCDRPLGNCSQQERNDAQESAMTCLANIIGDYPLPIDNSTTDPNISPLLDPKYPNFPFIEGYWNCDTCTFMNVAGYETRQPSTTLKLTGSGLFVGSAIIFILWLIVKFVMWVVFPQVERTFAPMPNSWEYSDDWAAQARRMRQAPLDIKRWVRSKQWMAGSPIPRAYSPDFGDEIEKHYHYGNGDGLQKVDEENGIELSPRDKQGPPSEVDDNDDLPDYWREWNERHEQT